MEKDSKWIDEKSLVMNSNKTQSMSPSRRKCKDEVAEVSLVHLGTELVNKIRV